MKTFLVYLTLILIGTGCASKRTIGKDVPTIEGVTTKNLHVTAEVDQALSLDHYCLVDIYLRNLNEDWLRVKSIEVVQVIGADHYRVIVGQDLKQWRKSLALDFDLRIQDANKPRDRKRLAAQKALISNYQDQDHLYQSFSIPSQLQAHKWILFQFDEKTTVSKFRFQITWIDNRSQTFEIDLVPKAAL